MVVLESRSSIDAFQHLLGSAKTQTGLPGEHVQLLNADHRHICKFEDPSDPNYTTLRNAFVAVIDNIDQNGKPLVSAYHR